jgi:hypothetical protein
MQSGSQDLSAQTNREERSDAREGQVDLAGLDLLALPAALAEEEDAGQGD